MLQQQNTLFAAPPLHSGNYHELIKFSTFFNFFKNLYFNFFVVGIEISSICFHNWKIIICFTFNQNYCNQNVFKILNSKKNVDAAPSQVPNNVASAADLERWVRYCNKDQVEENLDDNF